MNQSPSMFKLRITLAVFGALLVDMGIIEAKDARMSLDTARVQGVLVSRMTDIRSAEVYLKDGITLTAGSPRWKTGC